ncbi:hypothetical protein BH11PLA2_BH11PLA2_47230 [soil metagenome]
MMTDAEIEVYAARDAVAFYHRCCERILEELAVVDADVARVEGELSVAESRLRGEGAEDHGGPVVVMAVDVLDDDE